MMDADITVANETEFDLACDALGLAGADRKARMTTFVKRSGKTIIVTLGGEGAIALTPQGFISVPALNIKPIDTVGAGDTFCGYFGAALDAGLDLKPPCAAPLRPARWLVSNRARSQPFPARRKWTRL